MTSGPQNLDAAEGTRARVGRPPRLTTTQVIDAAIGLADERGLEALSMPKLARHLNVGTMTVYGYVDNKQDLLDKMAAHIFVGLTFTASGDWQQSLVAFFSDFRARALAHPTLAGLLATGRITIPAVFEILEAFLRRAADDGLRTDESVRVFYAALTYTIGFVLWEIPRAHLQPEGDYAEQWAGLIAELPPEEFPLVAGAASKVFPTVASSDQFVWGLARITTQATDGPRP